MHERNNKMKNLFVMLLVVMVSLATGQTAEKKGVKVGMTIQDLSNPVWAGYCQAIQKKIQSNGGSITYVSCESNAGKQITQIENFVSSGVDVLIVHPADPEGVESACKQARDKGIKVISWDDNLKNADLAWLIDNHKLGYTIGEAAAKWINDKLGGKAEVAILNYPQLPILLERGNGIKEAITKLAPNANIVAETSAINPAEGIAKMETIFQAHPNVKVVGCIGGGGSVGANEAAKAAGKIKDDFGIFAADATKPELAAMKNNEGVRMTVAITGTFKDSADKVWEMIEELESGKPIATKEVYRDLIPVTKENVDKFLHQ
jgi:ribose transport system substrate-binding protein